MRKKTCITFCLLMLKAVAPEMPQMAHTAKLKTRVQIRKSKKMIHLKLQLRASQTRLQATVSKTLEFDLHVAYSTLYVSMR